MELPPQTAPSTKRSHVQREDSQSDARRSNARDSIEETQNRQSPSVSQAVSNPPDDVHFSNDWASRLMQNDDEGHWAQSTNDSVFNPNEALGRTPIPSSGSEIASDNYFQSSSTFDAPVDQSNDSPEFTLPLNADSPPSPRLTSYIPDTDGFTGGTASPDNITNSLAARMGSLQIAEDGQLRYYGPTSNLHLNHNGLQSLSRSTIRHIFTEGSEVLKRAGLDQKISLSVEMHLAQLYFSWEDPAIHVVDEEIFFLEKQKWIAGNKNTPYYSETLNNAICAIGANLAAGERLDVREPAPEFFSSRAKALLDIEMDSPNVATVQGLVIMSASEAAFTRDARGWLYSGMAVRLSADLGLHLDLNDQYRSGMLSQRDMDVRRTTFRGVFIHDNMWSLYFGRPWGISIRDISVSRPLKELDAVRRKLWKPYPVSNGPSNMPSEGLPDPLEACTDANITLCEFMRRINRTLYSGRKIGIDELAKFLATTQKEFSSWMDNLSPELRVDLSNTDRVYIPHVLQLHMQFYAAIIFLFRPYFSHHLLRATQTLNTKEDRAAVARVKFDCISAAHTMVEVLRCIRKQHSLRHTNIHIFHLIFTASLIHIYNACTCTGAESQTALDDLQFCCQSLGEIGQTYGNATRALEVIILVKREWQKVAAVRTAQGFKRPNNALNYRGSGSADREDSDVRKKRRQSSNVTSDPLNPPQFLMPSAFETFRVPPNDLALGSQALNAPRDGGDIYDAWDFLNWADLGGEMVGEMNETQGLDGQILLENNNAMDQGFDSTSAWESGIHNMGQLG